MASPRCPRSECDGTSFRLTEFTPRDSRFKMTAVHCDRCGAVVGVTDYYNIGNALARIMEKIGLDINR